MKNYKQRYLLYFFILSLFFSGCIGFNVDVYSSNTVEKRVQKLAYPAKGWKKMKIYEVGELNYTVYDVITSIEVVANRTASEKKLLRKMREEAGCYRADAIVIESRQEVQRGYINGFAMALSLHRNLTVSDNDECPNDTTTTSIQGTGEYMALSITGLAIKFKG